MSARGSGLLQGGGVRGAKRRASVVRGDKLKNGIPNVHLSDASRIKREIPEFEDGRTYSQRELLLLAEKILLEDTKPRDQHPVWLTVAQQRRRAKAEIYVGNGIPDPAVESGLYNRTHPQGRKFNLDRSGDKGFYD